MGKEPAAEHGNAATTTTQRAAPAAEEAAASGGIKAPSIPVNPVSCQCGFVFVSGGFGPLLSNHGTVDTYYRKLHLFSSPVHPQLPPFSFKKKIVWPIQSALCFDPPVVRQDPGDFQFPQKCSPFALFFFFAVKCHADTCVCVCATCLAEFAFEFFFKKKKRIEKTKQIIGTKGEGYKDG